MVLLAPGLTVVYHTFCPARLLGRHCYGICVFFHMSCSYVFLFVQESCIRSAGDSSPLCATATLLAAPPMSLQQGENFVSLFDFILLCRALVCSRLSN